MRYGKHSCIYDVVVQVIQTVNCCAHSSPRIINTMNLSSGEQRCLNEVSEIAASPLDRGRVVVNIGRYHPVVLTVANSSSDWYLILLVTVSFSLEILDSVTVRQARSVSKNLPFLSTNTQWSNYSIIYEGAVKYGER